MDEERFTALVRGYQNLLWHIAYAMLHSEQDAADAVQEALLRAWRARNSFRGEASEKTWLTRIAVNVCKSMRRRRVIFAPLTEMEAPLPVDNAPLHDALAKLSPALAMPLVLVYLEGFTVEEASRALGIPPGTVKSRLYRGRKALARLIDREDVDW